MTSSGVQERNGTKFKQVSAEATIDNIGLRYLYGLYAGAHFALQIICISQENNFEKVAGDFSSMIHSVEFQNEISEKETVALPLE